MINSVTSKERNGVCIRRRVVSGKTGNVALVCRLVLLSSGHPRYLHSMVILGDSLLVFGGNTHNDTSKSRGAKCFSTDFMLYDISKCADIWSSFSRWLGWTALTTALCRVQILVWLELH